MKSAFIHKKDILIVGLILALALLLWLTVRVRNVNNAEIQAQIIVHGQLAKTVDLSVDRVFSVEGVPNVRFEIIEHRIRFSHSDCPDQICVRSGFLRSPNQSAACLPNHMVLIIIGSGAPNEFDIEVR